MKISKLFLEKIINELWPLNRSITGKDVRKTHKILSKITKIRTFEYKSKKKVFDWTIPPEWNVNDAFIINPDGKKILSFKKNNLHLMGYSKPFKGKLSLESLKKKLYSDPVRPNIIPYVTSYYKKKWGFCIKHKDLKKLKKGIYYVNIDTAFKNKGSLTLSEKFLKGKSSREILFQSYSCHPSMLVNELLGPIVLFYIAKYVEGLKNRKYSYRFVLSPETIGTISYLSENFSKMKKNFLAGYILTCLGLKDKFYYKMSKRNDSLSNRLAKDFFKFNKKKITSFNPGGSDERQYNMKGIDLPVGCIMSAIPGKYSQYHASSDNLKLLRPNLIIKTIQKLIKFIHYIEKKNFYKFKYNLCEPFLSKHVNFYGTINNSNSIAKKKTLILKWLIHFCDGEHSLEEIKNLSGLKIHELQNILNILKKKKLLK